MECPRIDGDTVDVRLSDESTDRTKVVQVALEVIE